MAESGRAFAKIAGRKDVILVKMLLLKFFWNIGSCSDQNIHCCERFEVYDHISLLEILFLEMLTSNW